MRSTLRSSVPSLAAGHSLEACVMRRSSSGARSATDAEQTELEMLAGEQGRIAALVAKMAADAAKALRFVAALRADRGLLREDRWHLADALAHARLGHPDSAQASAAAARSLNPALLDDRAHAGGTADR